MRPEFLAALEFAQGADQVDDPDELRRRFGQVVERFGVRYFASVVTAAPGQVLRPRFLFGEVDPAWSRHYERQGYAAVDPSVAALFETRTPFTWREALARRRSPAGERLLDEIAERTGADPISGDDACQCAASRGWDVLSPLSAAPTPEDATIKDPRALVPQGGDAAGLVRRAY